MGEEFSDKEPLGEVWEGISCPPEALCVCRLAVKGIEKGFFADKRFVYA